MFAILFLSRSDTPHRQINKEPISAPVQKETHLKTSDLTIDKPTPNKAAFHWSQIESEDFVTYAANLQSIGCPEATIKSIIQAELRDIYLEKRMELQKTVNEQDSTSRVPGSQAQRALNAQLLNLIQEENTLANNVMTQNAVGTHMVQAMPHRIAPPIIQVPLAMQPLYSDAPTVGSSNTRTALGRGSNTALIASGNAAPVLNQEQQAALAQVQQQFIQALGGTSQNPQDPAYLAQWQMAQEESDDATRASLGWQALNDLQMALANKQAKAAIEESIKHKP